MKFLLEHKSCKYTRTTWNVQTSSPTVAYLKCIFAFSGLFIYFNKCQESGRRGKHPGSKKKLKPHAHTTSERVKHVIVVTPSFFFSNLV